MAGRGVGRGVVQRVMAGGGAADEVFGPAGPRGRRPLVEEVPVVTPGAVRVRGLQDLTGNGGVRKQVLRSGSGQLVPPDSSVEVKYSGYLEDSAEPFCTNRNRKVPELMKLGKDITLWGLEIGLLTMRKGETARFIFKPSYAYGQQGCHPVIPPDATVTFEVELQDFINSAESDAFFELTPEQQDTFPLEKVLKVADAERQLGNFLYRKRNFECARDRYKRVLSILGRSSSSEAEQCQINTSKLLVLLNLSLTYLKLERPARALAYGEAALEIDQRNAKALFRCGQACLYMTQYEKARDFLLRAQHREPFNHEINEELKKLASCYKDYMEEKKKMCCRMFASLRSSD